MAQHSVVGGLIGERPLRVAVIATLQEGGIRQESVSLEEVGEVRERTLKVAVIATLPNGGEWGWVSINRWR